MCVRVSSEGQSHAYLAHLSYCNHMNLKAIACILHECLNVLLQSVASFCGSVCANLCACVCPCFLCTSSHTGLFVHATCECAVVCVCVVTDGPFNNLASMAACGVGMPKMWGVTLFFMTTQRATCYVCVHVCARSRVSLVCPLNVGSHNQKAYY